MILMTMPLDVALRPLHESQQHVFHNVLSVPLLRTCDNSRINTRLAVLVVTFSEIRPQPLMGSIGYHMHCICQMCGASFVIHFYSIRCVCDLALVPDVRRVEPLRPKGIASACFCRIDASAGHGGGCGKKFAMFEFTSLSGTTTQNQLQFGYTTTWRTRTN